MESEHAATEGRRCSAAAQLNVRDDVQTLVELPSDETTVWLGGWCTFWDGILPLTERVRIGDLLQDRLELSKQYLKATCDSICRVSATVGNSTYGAWQFF